MTTLQQAGINHLVSIGGDDTAYSASRVARYAQETIQGSCSLLLLTEQGIYAARDRLGRTPLVAGRRPGATAASLKTRIERRERRKCST